MRDNSSTRTPILSLPPHPRSHRRSLRQFGSSSMYLYKHEAAYRGSWQTPVISRRRSTRPTTTRNEFSTAYHLRALCAASCRLPTMPCSPRQVRALAISTRQSFLLLAHQSAEHTRSKQVRQSQLQLPLDAGKHWNRGGSFQG